MSDGKGRRPLTSKERKSLEKQRKNAAKQAEKYHKEKQSRIRELKNPPIRKRNSRKKLQKVKLRRLFSSKRRAEITKTSRKYEP